MTEAIERLEADARLARELTVGELRAVIEAGVLHGVLKAVAVYAVIAFVIGLIAALVSMS